MTTFLQVGRDAPMSLLSASTRPHPSNFRNSYRDALREHHCGDGATLNIQLANVAWQTMAGLLAASFAIGGGIRRTDDFRGLRYRLVTCSLGLHDQSVLIFPSSRLTTKPD